MTNAGYERIRVAEGLSYLYEFCVAAHNVSYKVSVRFGNNNKVSTCLVGCYELVFKNLGEVVPDCSHNKYGINAYLFHSKLEHFCGVLFQAPDIVVMLCSGSGNKLELTVINYVTTKLSEVFRKLGDDAQ